jgi:hypothetical protein
MPQVEALPERDGQSWIGRALGQFLMDAGEKLRDVNLAKDGIEIFSLADGEFVLSNGAQTFVEHATLKADAQLFVGTQTKDPAMIRKAIGGYEAALDALRTLGDQGRVNTMRRTIIDAQGVLAAIS